MKKMFGKTGMLILLLLILFGAAKCIRGAEDRRHQGYSYTLSMIMDTSCFV